MVASDLRPARAFIALPLPSPVHERNQSMPCAVAHEKTRLSSPGPFRASCDQTDDDIRLIIDVRFCGSSSTTGKCRSTTSARISSWRGSNSRPTSRETCESDGSTHRGGHRLCLVHKLTNLRELLRVRHWYLRDVIELPLLD